DRASDQDHPLPNTGERLLQILESMDVDVRSFDQAAERAEAGDMAALDEMSRWYRGLLLQDVPLESLSKDLQADLEAEQNARQDRVLRALDRLASIALGEGNLDAYERHLWAAVRADRLNEGRAQQLMRFLLDNKMPDDARRVYLDVRHSIEEEIEDEPSPAT